MLKVSGEEIVYNLRPYHIETSQLICSDNYLTGFCMTEATDIRSGVCNLNFEHIYHINLVFFIFKLEQVNGCLNIFTWTLKLSSIS